ncbi:hypothetical protein ColLi_01106 [Colletotrichum liriopes]|uniref:Uncharacterized protein n=1 Tax=Colletotrichum liriopes TaxID=708192 RepID=A0AA37LN65_9PEZI|nr:hypothetical protein ColLi_01106 [Colletotrichum liriopes]
MRQLSATLVAALVFSTAVLAQEVSLTYRTATITQCFTSTGLPFICNDCAPTPVVHKPAFTGGPICVEIQAPKCKKCGCDTCVQTVSYTTAYDAFCYTGLYKQEYAVTETYIGVAAKSIIPSTDVPLGFTWDVETCTTCGPTPVTATITRPITGDSRGAAASSSPSGTSGAQAGLYGPDGSSKPSSAPGGNGPGPQPGLRLKWKPGRVTSGWVKPRIRIFIL